VIRLEDIFLIFIFLGWLAKVAVDKRLGFLRFTTLNKPILIYILIGIISTGLGIITGVLDIRDSFFYLLKYFEYYIIFFMVVNNLKSLRQAKFFIFFILLTCFIVCLYAMARLPVEARLSAPFEGEAGEPNTLAGYLLLMIALMLGLILYSDSALQRLLLLVLCGLAIVVFVFTLSRGSWIAFFPMLLTFVILGKRYKHYLMLLFIILIIALPHISPRRVQERVQDVFTPDKTYYVMGKSYAVSDSTAERINSWKIGFSRWLERPILGYGIPSAGIIDNQYIRVLTETGLLGIIVFIWLMRMIFKVGWQAYISSGENNFVKGVSVGFLAGFIGILVQALSISTFIIIRIMEPFWFLAAIVVMLPQLAGLNEGVR
jgi:O-antigen ligase